MTTAISTQRFTGLPMASLREQSNSELTTAIRLPNDPGKTLIRVTSVLALYFDPDHDPKVKASIREEFVRALAAYPDWAVQRAFDTWTKTGQRRPTPSEIVILVERQIKPLTDELARRDREAAERREDRPELTAEEMERRRAFAAEVMAGVGFARGMTRHDGPCRETVTDEDRAEIAAILAKRTGAQ